VKIAIVGPAGAGKTTISKLFEKAGLTVVECDKVVHEAYKTMSR
jgi:dephospho-CoA kinase